ncbi:hypothetical protein ACR780_09370 [Sphingobacterium faecium]|jgi:hypothetical protein|uniref:hypothetical protein n=1 Tax=Sphingobacterium TaxID=28453 RepID=UPI0025CF713E|nr:hypothetical protein [Sphingobacterium sp. UBA6320]
MNNLELKSMGVQELNTNEMVDLDGGFIPMAVLLGIWAFQGAVCVAGIGLLASQK